VLYYVDANVNRIHLMDEAPKIDYNKNEDMEANVTISMMMNQ
jgi:hypothetical protein